VTIGARHFATVAAVIAVVAYVGLYGREGADAPIHSDGYSYHVYLPATFIYGDPSLAALANDWYGGTFPEFSGIRRWPSTGRWVNLHPIGTAISMAPFFLAAHAMSWWSDFPRDGFSFYYQHAAGLAGLVYMVAGLAVLARILRAHFTDGVVLATLASITWGTNLFHYGTFDSTFSHAFSFFLICVWLLLVDRWWIVPTPGRAIALGVVAALIVVTRYTNAIFLILLPLFGIASLHDVAVRLRELRTRGASLALAAVAAAIAAAPNFVLYKWITGQWFVSSYAAVGAGFNFGSPHLVDVLFSTQKGLFFWSPILLLAVVGAALAKGWTRGLVVPASIIFIADVYLVASWSYWQFGATFGHRAFTDGFGLAAPFLASTFEWAARRRWTVAVVSLLATAVVLLSAAQMIQYWMGILPTADTTWTQYRMLFLRFQ
jgi:hypothetical protein